MKERSTDMRDIICEAAHQSVFIPIAASESHLCFSFRKNCQGRMVSDLKRRAKIDPIAGSLNAGFLTAGYSSAGILAGGVV